MGPTFTFFFLHVKQPPLDLLCGRFATKPVLRRGIVVGQEQISADSNNSISCGTEARHRVLYRSGLVSATMTL